MNRKVLILLLGVAIASGCASVSTGGFQISACEGAKEMGDVRIEDCQFARKFSVEAAAVRREPSGFARAQFFIKSLRRQDIPIQYKFKFFDSDGLEVQPNVRAWEQLIIHGGESITLSAVAPDKSVVKFVVYIRRTM